MKQKFQGWELVAEKLSSIVKDRKFNIKEGQASSLSALAERLPQHGVIIADEVGMGKTRIASALAQAVIEAGGRVAILVPPGLGFQWNSELKTVGVESPPILRSLRQYLLAWDPENKEKSTPWFKESVVVISHAFANWRINDTKQMWRWSLLPEIYAQHRKMKSGRFPRNYLYQEEEDTRFMPNVEAAADCIVSSIYARPKCLASLDILNDLTEKTEWPEARDAENYGNQMDLREPLEKAVGLGLGIFDLFIIDEAHKSKGQESGLNRLLCKVIHPSKHARRLGMTATPVELDPSQWEVMLKRIKIGDAINEVEPAIHGYVTSVARVRLKPWDETVFDVFKDSAQRFKTQLSPYLLRRDKREDESVITFMEKSKESYHAYRRQTEIKIETTEISSAWKQAVCAAEALSYVTIQSEHSVAKRLRLTIGNGHGLSTFLDLFKQDEVEDQSQIKADAEEAKALSEVSTPLVALMPPTQDGQVLTKKQQRTLWWSGTIKQAFEGNESAALYEHPAILAAVKEIESVCDEGEKVLVFGRFTKPMRALEQLLNAREMLRCLDTERPWPQEKVHENDSWDAIVAAYNQLDMKGSVERVALDQRLKSQYAAIENSRRSFREHLIQRIEEGLKIILPSAHINALFKSFKEAAVNPSEQGDDHSLAIVSRAIQELLSVQGTPLSTDATEQDMAQAFVDLVAAVSERDEGDDNGDGELDDHEAKKLWKTLYERLHSEFNRPEGGFARLMNGNTRPETRRLLQLAFNRPHGYPKVLIAQSVVGREGLNLHEACRTVVLLHPEWNPGVVEQQIGRVDRYNSLWSKKMNAVDPGAEATEYPRIDILPVVFEGTYDEKNFQVLQDRWDDLRAQLHGIIITPRLAERYGYEDTLVKKINGAAPNFSPSKSECQQAPLGNS